MRSGSNLETEFGHRRIGIGFGRSKTFENRIYPHLQKLSGSHPSTIANDLLSSCITLAIRQKVHLCQIQIHSILAVVFDMDGLMFNTEDIYDIVGSRLLNISRSRIYT